MLIGVQNFFYKIYRISRTVGCFTHWQSLLSTYVPTLLQKEWASTRAMGLPKRKAQAVKRKPSTFSTKAVFTTFLEIPVNCKAPLHPKHRPCQNLNVTRMGTEMGGTNMTTTSRGSTIQYDSQGSGNITDKPLLALGMTQTLGVMHMHMHASFWPT